MNPHPELYACLLINQFPAQAMLRLRPELDHRPVVVLAGDPPCETVCSLNHHAAVLGITPTQRRAQLDAFAGVAVLRRSPSEESTAYAALLSACGMFSPRVEDQSRHTTCIFVLDLTGTARLLGPAESVLGKLLATAAALRLTATVVLSANFHAAVCAAHSGHSSVIPAGEEAAALHNLPLSTCNMPPECATSLQHWGIHTLGQLALLPHEGLITRLGQSAKNLQQLARGACPHLFQPVAPPFTLEEHIELETPVELLDSLLFVLHPMLDQLLLRARTRSLAIATLTVTFTTGPGAAHIRTLRPALPAEDKTLLLKLLHLDLQAHPPGAAVLAIHLHAAPGSVSKVQLGLFTPPLPEPSRLDVTLARIRSVVGEANVGRAVLDDTHQPEAFHIEPFTVPQLTAAQTTPPASTATVAMRMLRPPEPIAVTLRNQHPVTFCFRAQQYSVSRAYGPWHTGGAWWSGDAWSLAGWDILATAPDQSLLACCLTCDLASGLWSLTALYD